MAAVDAAAVDGGQYIAVLGQAVASGEFILDFA